MFLNVGLNFFKVKFEVIMFFWNFNLFLNVLVVDSVVLPMWRKFKKLQFFVIDN